LSKKFGRAAAAILGRNETTRDTMATVKMTRTLKPIAKPTKYETDPSVVDSIVSITHNAEIKYDLIRWWNATGSVTPAEFWEAFKNPSFRANIIKYLTDIAEHIYQINYICAPTQTRAIKNRRGWIDIPLNSLGRITMRCTQFIDLLSPTEYIIDSREFNGIRFPCQKWRSRNVERTASRIVEAPVPSNDEDPN
jgi:hypothetical protein